MTTHGERGKDTWSGVLLVFLILVSFWYDRAGEQAKHACKTSIQAQQGAEVSLELRDVQIGLKRTRVTYLSGKTVLVGCEVNPLSLEVTLLQDR